MADDTHFYFPVPKYPDSSDPRAVELLEPIYKAFNAIYNDFVYSCGVVSPPIGEYERLAETNWKSCQPQNLNRFFVKAYEALAFGMPVHFFKDAGELKVKKAQGGAGSLKASGYVNTPGGITANAFCEVIVGSGLLPITGATVGQEYWLSTTAGNLSTAAPGSGLVQKVGRCIADDYVYMNFFQD